MPKCAVTATVHLYRQAKYMYTKLLTNMDTDTFSLSSHPVSMIINSPHNH